MCCDLIINDYIVWPLLDNMVGETELEFVNSKVMNLQMAEIFTQWRDFFESSFMLSGEIIITSNIWITIIGFTYTYSSLASYIKQINIFPIHVVFKR